MRVTNWKLSALLSIALASLGLASAGTVPLNPAEDQAFLRCVENGECGAENRCSFRLQGYDPSAVNNTSGADGVVTVGGHLMTVKNRMPYSVIFYWDVLGYNPPSGEPSSSRYHGVYARPNSANYVDTGYYGSHTFRLYVYTLGNDPGVLDDPVDAQNLEFLQSLVASEEECTKFQACSLLNNVCYMASPTNEACRSYRYACEGFNEGDAAKYACIPECVFTYWADRFDETPEIDSEGVVGCIERGCGVRDGGANGLCNTSAVVGLSIVMTLSLLVNLLVGVLACMYKAPSAYGRGGDGWDGRGDSGSEADDPVAGGSVMFG
jgi:hypothetical protein